MSSPHDQTILDAFVAELAASLVVEELTEEVRAVSTLVAARNARTAQLASTGRRLLEAAAELRGAIAAPGGTTADVVRKSIDRLELLGGDLVDLGRIETGELTVDVIDVSVAGVLAAALDDPRVDRDRVALQASVLPSVSADESLLRRALVETLVDAIDASDPAAVVRVAAGVVGPGIDIRIIDRRRRDATADAESGLFIAQAFVLAMRGRFEQEETPGGGTTVVIRLAVPGGAGDGEGPPA